MTLINLMNQRVTRYITSASEETILVSAKFKLVIRNIQPKCSIRSTCNIKFLYTVSNYYGKDLKINVISLNEC